MLNLFLTILSFIVLNHLRQRFLVYVIDYFSMTEERLEKIFWASASIPFISFIFLFI